MNYQPQTKHKGFTSLEIKIYNRQISDRVSKKFLTGFTLAEAMMATVVLGIAAAGVLLPFTSGAAVRAEGMRRTLAARLASDLMEEFINTSFEELVADGGGYVDELQGQIKDVNGALFSDPAYANFSRGASYEYDDSQSFFIIVTVWVKYNGNEIVSLSRLISK